MLKVSNSVKQSIGSSIAKILKLKRMLLDNKMKSFGLSRTQWQVLLWMKDLGSCSQQQLLTIIDIDAAHLARVLEQLEKDGFVIRTRCKDDRRALLISLTEQCQTNFIPKLNKIINDETKILLNNLTNSEIESLSQMLNKIETNLQSFLTK